MIKSKSIFIFYICLSIVFFWCLLVVVYTSSKNVYSTTTGIEKHFFIGMNTKKLYFESVPLEPRISGSGLDWLDDRYPIKINEKIILDLRDISLATQDLCYEVKGSFCL